MRGLVLAVAVAAALVPVAPAAAHQAAQRESPGHAASSQWQVLPTSPQARTEVGGAAVGRAVYVFGGYGSASTPTRAVTRFDVDRGSWSSVRPMPVALNHAVGVGYGGDLYVVGGYTGTPFSLGPGTGGIADATADLWRYDPERDSWSRMPPAPSRRASAAAAVIGDELMVAAGGDGLRALTRFEIFNFKTGRWRRGPELPLATEHTAGAAAGGQFYVVGGRPFYGGGTNRFVQRYDPRSGRWTRVADLNRGHAGFAAVTVCDRVVAYGGEDPGTSATGTVAAVERYDPERNRWERLPDMRTPRHGFGGATVGDRIFALEGGPVTLLSITNVSEALRVGCPSADSTPPTGPAPAGGRDETGNRRQPGDRARSTASVAQRSRIAARPRRALDAGDELPFTGLSLLPLALAGATLCLAGALLRGATPPRRRGK